MFIPGSLPKYYLNKQQHKLFHQFSSVDQYCLTLCNPMDHSTTGIPDDHQLPKFTQTQAHWVHDTTQPSHPLSFPSPPTFNLSQHHGLFKWISSSHQVAKVLEFQFQFSYQKVNLWLYRKIKVVSIREHYLDRHCVSENEGQTQSIYLDS